MELKDGVFVVVKWLIFFINEEKYLEKKFKFVNEVNFFKIYFLLVNFMIVFWSCVLSCFVCGNRMFFWNWGLLFLSVLIFDWEVFNLLKGVL